MPKSETVLHKVKRNELFRFSPAVPSSSPLMLQSLTIGRAIGTGAPTADAFLDGEATKSEDYKADVRRNGVRTLTIASS